MFVRVKNTFKDKETKKRREKGSIFEASEDRVKEILKVGELVEKVDGKNSKFSEGELKKLSLKGLQALAKEKGLDAKGRKEELIKRISETTEVANKSSEEKENEKLED